MIFCSRCGKELEGEKLWTNAYVSDIEIICGDCW
jgi:hypothetical protein